MESIKKKIGCANLSDNIHLHIHKRENTPAFNGVIIDKNPNPDWWIYRTMAFSGHSNQRSKDIGEFYALISNNIEFNKVCGQYKELDKKIISVQTKQEKNFIEYYIPFNTKGELKNFWKYIHTDFINIILYMYKLSLHIDSKEQTHIPWQDFTQEWDNYKLFKKYNLTKEEVQHIYDILPNYYGIKRINLDNY